MTKVSIIMPIYNCEEYLHESISSVMRQTLSEWELLCIDDGSSDSSLQIIEEFSSKDDRVRVYTQKNQGAGIARNKGLQYATGEFVAFLDADDFFLDADALECMYEVCKAKQVKACGTNLRIYRGGKAARDIIFDEIDKLLNSKSIFHYRDFQFDYGYYCFIFERNILIKHHIEFPSYSRFQDPPFFVKAMYVIDEFCFIDKALYCYRAPNTIARVAENKIKGLLEGLHDNLQFAKVHDLSKLFGKTIHRLEDEYGDIICHSFAENSIDTLKMLLKINDLVQEVCGNTYVIYPLRKILGSVSKAEMRQKEEFMGKLLSKSSIYIYGAGKMTIDFLSFLKTKDLFYKVQGILVTDKTNNPDKLADIEVGSIDEYCYQDGDIVIIAVSGIYQEEIVRMLEKKGVLAYERINVKVFDVDD